MPDAAPLSELNDRSREIFRRLVETYIETGEPVGSRTISRGLEAPLSAASVRNVMQDLEQLGFLESPHASAGRIPTHSGLRMFVDGLLELGEISAEERAEIEKLNGDRDGDIANALDHAGSLLSGLSQCASLIFAPKREAPIRHVEFVSLNPGAALVVLVTEDGAVENRMIAPPAGMTPSAMREAANFLNAMLVGRTLGDAKEAIAREIERRRQELDATARALVEAGVAVWDGEGEIEPDRLLVRGRANLLTEAAADLDRIRHLLDDLERKRDIAQLLDLAKEGDGVRIFIGSENKLFSLSGSTLVISPYMNADRKLVGAIGVIGPTRLNYGRIVPIVDYTARMMGEVLAGRGKTAPR
ncbi:heat-inducible transcriptional repressor HrcA [Pikeienuella piscinae]|uniref:Heat-inducible transcription repressor HrcA n=1 Tax=Pikeienuella piscinae TaxID=2748098 RepID=A0A7M3T583_9RHOB|nr:heat-inducible transcriptional repressor HrcA [Pikeienuella piscinae]QIE57164.1 heat-inducible transcriptional repressor HrcA [Pikeienuella piscinae]